MEGKVLVKIPKSNEYLEVDKSIKYSEAEIMSEYLKLLRVSANIRTSEYPSRP